LINIALCLTPRISNGGLLVVLWFVLRAIVRVSGQVIALNPATAHTRKRYAQLPKYPDLYFGYKKQHGIISQETF
jgi:hypothetical protein